jgi:CubicO group peptidase (beta-lactamase class C family)
MSKSVISLVIGAAIQDGLIASIDDPIERYLPELKPTGYAGLTVRNLLMTRTGTDWKEIYTPGSDWIAIATFAAGPSSKPRFRTTTPLWARWSRSVWVWAPSSPRPAKTQTPSSTWWIVGFIRPSGLGGIKSCPQHDVKKLALRGGRAL